MSGPLLSVQRLTVRYTGVVAVNDVSFDVPEGSFTGLIGPNGAGKTTMVDALSGFARYEGSVVFAGRNLDDAVAHKRTRLGLARTFQSVELFDDLTVRENILVGAGRGSLGGVFQEIVLGRRPKADESVDEICCSSESDSPERIRT